MSAAGLEKRSGFRRSSPGRVITIAPVLDAGRNFFGHAQNISCSGMLIHTYMPIAEGDELDMEFTLPGTESVIRCRAKVVWASNFKRGGATVSRGGLRFLELDSALISQINRWANGEIT
ncbi:MAG: PilZ domain-containing protein [Nitrospirota bacterium]